MIKNIALCFMLSAVFLSACKKKDETPSQPTFDIYALGSIGNPPDAIKPVYWKNGQLMTLQAPNTVDDLTRNMALKGTDIYTVGSFKGTNGMAHAAYWKNGILKDVSKGFIASTIISISFKGDDIYMLGYGTIADDINNDRYPVVWKNDIPVVLPTIPTVQNYVDIIFNSNNSYLLVDVKTTANTQVAGYIKDGVLVKVQDTISSSEATAIAISGNDVYMCGGAITNNTFNGVYWKNGIKIQLEANGQAVVKAIAVSGNDVYVAGSNNGATIWKNGQIIFHDNGMFSVASSIVIDGNDIYAGGNDNADNAVIWKNGKIMQLSGSGDEKSRVEHVILLHH
ncbi:hypothetical protein [Mucilaginibacter sp.]|uniref:hypothetical protein n=1 Tax=Mucilaginibacter sp. TaxID=1882438 RepID=UPI0031B5892C